MLEVSSGFIYFLLKLEGGWMLEVSLQYDHNLGFQEDEAGIERFHLIGRFPSDN